MKLASVVSSYSNEFSWLIFVIYIMIYDLHVNKESCNDISKVFYILPIYICWLISNIYNINTYTPEFKNINCKENKENVQLLSDFQNWSNIAYKLFL